MGLVTGVAGTSAGVVCGRYLREPFRLGAVGFMATRTKNGGVELRRLNAGVVCMVGQCAVTGFAGDYDVLAMALLVDDIGVAGLAGLVTGVDDGLRGDFSNSRTAEVAVLAKAFGDDGCAHDHKRRENEQHDNGEPDQMFYVLEQVRLPGNAIRITIPHKLYMA